MQCWNSKHTGKKQPVTYIKLCSMRNEQLSLPITSPPIPTLCTTSAHLRAPLHNGEHYRRVRESAALGHHHVPPTQHPHTFHKPCLPALHRPRHFAPTAPGQGLQDHHKAIQRARGEEGVSLAAKELVGIGEGHVQTAERERCTTVVRWFCDTCEGTQGIITSCEHSCQL